MGTIIHDLRLALRRVMARRGLSAAVVLTLALGVGANTAVFSLVRGILIEPLPYVSPDRLVMVWKPGRDTDQTWLSLREWIEYSRSTQSFEQLAAYTTTEANLTGDAEPERVRAAFVTRNVFATLGVSALQGRTFSLDESAPDGDDAVVLGYELWQRRFGGAADVVGRTIQVNGRARTVLGIMSSDFRLPLDYREDRPTEIWIQDAVAQASSRPFGDRSYFVYGRLRDGVTPAIASAELAGVGRQWEDAGLIRNDDGRLTRDAIPLNELLTGTLRPMLLLLFGAVGVVLLIACANVTNLLLARSDSRRRDVATQAALGASRARIARELLFESGLLALGGALLGVLVAYGGVRATLAFTPVNVLRAREIPMDAWVLVFSALVALATSLLAGLAPALQLARVELSAALAAGGRSGSGPTRKRMRHALVVGQTAMSVVLVIGAGLLIRSFIALRSVDLGFDTEDILSFRVALPAAQYPDVDRVTGFYRELTDRLEQVNGVRSAAAVRILPLTRTIGDWSITIENVPDAGTNPNGDWQVVTPGYFETMGLLLLRGRFFTDADRADAQQVVIIDENMAERYWPGMDALGRRFHLGTSDQPWMTIVGITRAVRHNAVVEEPRTEMFVPHGQFGNQTGYAPMAMTIVMRTERAPLTLLDAARAQLRAIDPDLPMSEARTMDAVAANALAAPRFLTLLLGSFALLALGLAAIGMYGVIAFMVARREHEIGIRMALGAERFRIIRMVLGEGIGLALAGIALGIAGALWLSRLLASQLHGVSPLDPLTFVVVPALLLLVAGAAALAPARRAATNNPLRALGR